MKKLSLLALMGATSLFMFSCKDDEAATVAGPEFPEKFSARTVEENKAQLENNGIAMVNEMEALKNQKGVDVSVNLVRLMDYMGNSEEESIPGGRILKSVSGLRKGAKSSEQLFSAMHLSEDPSSIKEAFDNNAGTYTWNDGNEEWDFTEGGDKIIFKFPATEAGTQNNAVFTLRDYTGVQVSNPIEEEYEGDLPTNLVMDLSVDGASVMEYGFKAAYNNSGEPTSLQTHLTLSSFTFAVDFTNDTKKVVVNQSLKNGDKLLIGIGASTEGNFVSDNIENVENPDDVVNNASAYFQVLNIKVSGTVNVKDGMAAYNGLASGLSEQEKAEKTSEIANEYYDLVVYYADSKEKIAETEFYTYSDTYTTWVDSNGDGWYQEGEDAEVESSELGMRLIFADESKSDFETYFETGFDDFQDELETFMNSLD